MTLSLLREPRGRGQVGPAIDDNDTVVARHRRPRGDDKGPLVRQSCAHSRIIRGRTNQWSLTVDHGQMALTDLLESAICP
jgi:hypothetical protein